MRYVVLYLATGLIFLAVDALVLGTVGGKIFRDVLGDRLRETPQMGAAAAFYLVYTIGVIYFASAPAARAGDWTIALINGALFGFFAYLTFEASAYAVLEGWKPRLVIIDTLWGTVLTGGSAVAGYWITKALGQLPSG